MSNTCISIISILSIICLFIIAILIIIKKVTKISKTILWFFIPVFIVSWFLNFCAVYNSNLDVPFLLQVFQTVTVALKMFKFEVSISTVEALVNQNFIYLVALCFCYCMASLNTIYIIALLLINSFNDYLKSFIIRKKAHNIILLDSSEQLQMIKKLKKPSIIIVNEKSQLNDLQKTYCGSPCSIIYEPNYEKSLLKAGIKNKNTTFISLSTNEKINNNYIKILNNILPIHNKAIINSDATDVSKYVKSEKDIVFYNIHNIISRNFIEKYPLYTEIDETMINHKYGILTNTNIHHFFMGFTNTSKCMLDDIIKNYQMINDDIQIYICDSNAGSIISKHQGNYYVNTKIENIIKKGYSSDEYFELYSSKFNLIPLPYKQGTYELKQSILDNLGYYTLVYVDYGSDLVNFEEALNLAIFLQHLKCRNVKIYVKLNNIENIHTEQLENYNISIYGDNIEELQMKLIEDQTLDYMAIRVNYYYAKKYQGLKDGDTDKSLWNKCSIINKNSNRYVATNIIIKLNLLGLTLSNDPSIKGLTKEEYLSFYNPNNEQGVQLNLETYKYDNARINLGMLEHYRWNTFELFNNIWIMKKQEIFKDGKYIRKHYQLKQHSNILSIKGMLDLEEAIKKMPSLSTKQKDEDSKIFIKDFETMDNLYEIIEGTDYKIIINKK